MESVKRVKMDKFFTEKDIEQINSRGISLETVIAQLEALKMGFPYTELSRPCTVRDGIEVISNSNLERLSRIYSKAALEGRAMKFVPASGAASRMFKLLLSVYNNQDNLDMEYISAKSKEGVADFKGLLQFLKEVKRFAFYEDLKSVMSRDGLDIETHLSKGRYNEILQYLLTPKGLDYAMLPKGLIKFHRYPDHTRTPFEEHLVEAAGYTRDRFNVCRLHFTLSPEYEELVRDYIHNSRARFETSGIKYELTFSIQKPSTDTIAVDLDNKPFRNEDGTLLFRQGGHGALLENLNELKGDIVFITNIDNVVPDRLKEYEYKRAMGGYLIELQTEIFGYLETLLDKQSDELLLEEIFEFARTKLSIIPPESLERSGVEKRASFLYSKLNRPIRVCGMVENKGDPGGGPFWVLQQGLPDDKRQDKFLSIQIVELSQVNMGLPEQRAIWDSSTHFSPVNIVCGVRDFLGSPFDLRRFVDPNTGFISIKSKDGREVKALELPGLWNGGMANWNTILVEVPLSTFNPVKTVSDLLREEHQD